MNLFKSKTKPLKEEITFEAASLSTILWTDEGFIPKGSIEETGEELAEYFNKNNIVCNFNPTKKDNSMDRIDFPDFDIKGNQIDSHIYLGNRDEGHRAKIVVNANPEFRENPLDAKKTVELITSVLETEKSICGLIYNKIPQAYSLGNPKYLSNIVSVESRDPDIAEIIKYELPNSKTKFEQSLLKGEIDPILSKKILDIYSILLLNQKEPVTYEEIQSSINRLDAKQSGMILYGNGDKIPVKTLNYEVPAVQSWLNIIKNI
ncbi:MAG: hypothetical protein DRP06_02805 [Candidatus Aenigmatarchaeota archaeon]|nr:MAG: hypothetical protein DRP06_02805 [Candidatus Aenigmarchaeota archaeon]